MKDITITVYEFDELNDKAKERAREWFREGNNIDTFWSECVIDDAKEVARFLGIEIKNIYWSGFSSQGDGACFEGEFDASQVNVKKLMEYTSQDLRLQGIAKEFEQLSYKYPTLRFWTKHSGRYNHENSVDYDFDDRDEEGEDIGLSFDDLHSIKAMSQNFMKWIYSQLEKAWDYENSNEAVDDNIMANKYTFTIDGKRFGN